jgi:hypothetical protein
MREVDTLRNVDMAQRKMDDSRTIATIGALIAVVQRARAARSTQVRPFAPRLVPANGLGA